MSIWQRFEEICETHSDRTAVVDDATVLDYRTLSRMTCALARRLERLHLDSDFAAAVVLDTDWRSAPVLLALTRSGITFVPVDGSLPPARITAQVKACGASLVVTSARHAAAISEACGDAGVLQVDEALNAAGCTDCAPPVAGAHTCHILTSGSTGLPKRVVYTPGMILHDVAVRTNELAVSPSDRFAQVVGGTSLPVMTLFLALLNGASLHFHDVKQRGFSDLAAWIADSGISVLRLTPTLFRELARTITVETTPACLRLVSTGGERLNIDDARLFQEKFPFGSVLLNHLSSTECRVVCQYFIDHGTPLTGPGVPVGWPLDGFEVVILDDDDGRPAPVGTVGEIVVRSAWITPGWFEGTGGLVRLPRDNGVITHHTGDLGLARADGCIEHHGRKDRMVKIRGYRIELDEIESVLAALCGVEQVAAFVYEAEGHPPDLAVFIAGGELQATAGDIRRRIFGELGLFGMPQRVEIRKRLPVTGNGKIDRSLLVDELARS